MLPERRRGAIQRARRALEKGSWPRLEMAAIVAFTGGIGFLASFLLLHGGLDRMWLRYPAALLVAYLFFLVLLWLWMRLRGDGLDIVDVADVGGNPRGGSGGDCGAERLEGGGGDFGGGGASGNFEDAGGSGVLDQVEKVADIGDVAFGADEGCLPILLLLVVIAIVGWLLASAFYIVLGAPTLMAELIVDGILSYTLYRKLRRGDEPHWLMTAVRHTIGPFAMAAGFLVIAGATMAHLVPGARTMGEFVDATSQD